jgi:hypothetical protein
MAHIDGVHSKSAAHKRETKPGDTVHDAHTPSAAAQRVGHSPSKSADAGSAPTPKDHHAPSETKAGGERRQSGWLSGLEANFGGPERRSGVDRRQTDAEAAETARHNNNEKTLSVLHNYADFTNGKDDITSRDDYRKIAAGERNKDFGQYLKEKNPGWSQQQIDSEVESLQDSSKTLLTDRKLFQLADTGKEGGKGDGKISDADLVAARLKNDISKDRPPILGVEQIAALHEKNPGLGNQAITNKYAHEADELSKLLGGDKDHFLASWPAYGQHASNSAGAFVRDDGVPGNDNIQNAVADGNRKVFKDIAPHYDSYIDTFKNDPKADFKEWESKQDFKDKPYLKQSFEFLEKARTTTDPDKKQEYLLASNALAGYHEQRRLDPNIDKATAPGTSTGLERGVWSLLADEKPNLYLPNGKGAGDLSAIDVSKKLDVPSGAIPKGLETIDDPEVRNVLQTVLDNPNADVSGARALIDQSGTADWSKLPDRMRTIVALMASGQNDPRLAEYALDYNLPDSPSTLDHAKAVLDSFVDKSVGMAETGIEIAGKGIDIAGQGINIAGKGIEIATSVWPF